MYIRKGILILTVIDSNFSLFKYYKVCKTLMPENMAGVEFCCYIEMLLCRKQKER